MLTCDKCNKEFKSKAGLVAHTKVCIEVIDENQELVLELRAKALACKDAVGRYNIEQQIVSMGYTVR